MRIAALLCVIGWGCGRLDFDPVAVCPAGYVPAADFCVMQFEAKAVQGGAADPTGCGEPCGENFGIGTHVAASVPEGRPWRWLSASNAHAACAALGPGYALIANAEWMVIARDLERVPANWLGGVVGQGRIPEGNSEDGPEAAVDDPADPYSNTSGALEQRRTHALANGGIVWDLAGNVQEWIDWTPDAALDSPPPCAGGELPAVACSGFAADDFQTSTGTYDRTHGVGYFIGGSGDVARRGGQISDRPEGYAGIYAINVNRNRDEAYPATGFRCVYRP